MKIGKRIFYDKVTGGVILDVQPQESTLETVERNIEQFSELSERNRETFDVIELEYGEYSQEFREASGYRVNPETKELEFSHPDPAEPEAPPVFEKPLTDQIKELKDRDARMQDDLNFIIETIGG